MLYKLTAQWNDIFCIFGTDLQTSLTDYLTLVAQNLSYSGFASATKRLV